MDLPSSIIPSSIDLHPPYSRARSSPNTLEQNPDFIHGGWVIGWVNFYRDPITLTQRDIFPVCLAEPMSAHVRQCVSSFWNNRCHLNIAWRLLTLGSAPWLRRGPAEPPVWAHSRIGSANNP